MFPQILTITHNYSEAGHGKGPPDGVGGLLKSICDDEVAQGTDVNNFDAFCTVIERRTESVMIKIIDESSICVIENLIPQKLTPFAGTLQVHQLKWTKEKKDSVFFNSLSCFACDASDTCCHYNMDKSPWSIPR